MFKICSLFFKRSTYQSIKLLIFEVSVEKYYAHLRAKIFFLISIENNFWIAQKSERALKLTLRAFSELRSESRSGLKIGVALRPALRPLGAPLRSGAPRSAAL